MAAIILVVFTLTGFGFACGYLTREWMSRRRRAAARKQYYERHPEERRD